MSHTTKDKKRLLSRVRRIKGQTEATERALENFLKWRVRPIAQKLGIPDRLVTFQMMRRTLGTDMQQRYSRGFVFSD
jgi:hypothetical protein